MLNDVLSALADADEARYAETSIQNAARKMRQSFGPHYAQFFSKKHLMWLAKAAFQFSAISPLRFSLNCAPPNCSHKVQKLITTSGDLLQTFGHACQRLTTTAGLCGI